MTNEVCLNQEDHKLLISVPEMAHRLGISRANGYCLVHSTNGPRSIRVGKRLLVPTNELQRWISEKMQNAGGAY